MEEYYAFNQKIIYDISSQVFVGKEKFCENTSVTGEKLRIAGGGGGNCDNDIVVRMSTINYTCLRLWHYRAGVQAFFSRPFVHADISPNRYETAVGRDDAGDNAGLCRSETTR